MRTARFAPGVTEEERHGEAPNHRVHGDHDLHGHRVTRGVLWDGTGDPVEWIEKLLDVPMGTYDHLRGKTLEEIQAMLAGEVQKRESGEGQT